MLSTIRSEVPPAAQSLGFSGAAPFVALALLSFAGDEVGAWAVLALLGYGAVILSFLGGVHWGLAMAQADPGAQRLGLSVVPSLIGWLGLLIGGAYGMGVLAAGFAAMLWLDLRATARGIAPAWYPRLRWPLTLIVVASLVAALVAAS